MKNIFKNFFLIILMTILGTDLILAQEFENGNIGATLNSWGRVRVYSPLIDAANVQIDRLSFLVGGNVNEVFDYFNDAGTVDTLRNIDNPSISDFEIYVSVDNSYPATLDPPEDPLPPAVGLAINVYGWNTGDYFLAKYTVTNLEAKSKMTFKPGFEILPQIDGAYGFETVNYSEIDNSIKIFKGGLATNVKIKSLSEDISNLTAFNWFDGYNSSDTALYNWLHTEGIFDGLGSDDNGAVAIGGFQEISLEPNESKEYWMAFAVGDRTNINDHMADAIAKYETIITDIDENQNIPLEYKLSQNYPNPFNPSTKIEFSIPERSFVQLSIYNSIGQEVYKIINKEMNTGFHSVDFNAGELTSGIYLYRLTAGEFISTKKMILIK